MTIKHWFIRKLGGHVPSVVCDERERAYMKNLMLSHIREHQRLMNRDLSLKTKRRNKQIRGKLK